MNRKQYEADNLPTQIVIGRQTETGVMSIYFDCTGWLTWWPNLTLSIWVTPPGGSSAYLATTHMEDKLLVWDVDNADTATAGQGTMEIVGTASGQRKLSAVTATKILASTTTKVTNPPEKGQSFLDQMAATTAKAEDATEAAKAAAAEADAAAAKAADITETATAAETDRVQAESIRAANEQNRVDAEGLRADAETGRAQAESDRATAETQRQSAEQDRAIAEQQRATAETARAEAETQRQSAEQDRAIAEQQRATAETARAEAETQRQSAEAERRETFAGFEGEIGSLKDDFVELENDLYSKSDNIYDENQEFLQDKYIPYWDSPNIDVLVDEVGKYTTQIIPCDAIAYCCIGANGNITSVADTFAYYDSNGNYLGKGSNGIIPKNDNTASIRITFNSEARKNILKAIVPYVDGKASGYEVNPYGKERKFVVKEELTPLATKEELTQATSAISILYIQNDVDCHFREMKKNIATWKNLILKDGKEDSEYYPEFEKGVICIQADDGNADIKAFSDLCNEYGFTLDLALPLEKLDNSCDGRTIKDVALEMQSNGSEILVHHTDVLTSEYKGNPQMLFDFFGKRKFDMQKEGFNVRGIILSGGPGYNTADFAEAVKWCNHYYEYSDMYGSGQKFPMYRMGRLTCLGTDNLETLKNSITNKINEKTFAIIYTHGISATGTDSYQTNESTMRSFLSWLKETYIDTGLAENLSMGEMVDKYGISLLQRKLSN